jgi:hypothetical protein
MKSNEALLIGVALLAALVLSKGGVLSSNVKQFSGKSAIPVLPIENKTPIFQIPQIETFLQKIKLPDLQIFKQFFPVTDTNVQLKQILNIEEKKKNERVSYLQNELDQTNAAILGYERFKEKTAPIRAARYYGIETGYLYQSDVDNIRKITKREKIEDQDIINYYENLFKSESALGYGGSITGGASRQFPKLSAPLKALYENIFSERENIARQEFAAQQQEGINQVIEEYQTRFGGLSRYG